MKNSLRQKLDTLQARLHELNHLLSQENATDDLTVYRKLSQEHADILPIVTQYQDYLAVEADVQTAQMLLADVEFKQFAQAELLESKEKQATLLEAIQLLLLPRDEDDEKDIFVEIRAGTGGDESGIFAGDLFRMYTRYAERQRWQIELVSANGADMGGYKEVIFKIIGRGAYARLKFESGGHRVQRVPETEAQGRIHTSACTVAILPVADEIDDVVLNPAELRIDTYRASGAGGQHVNKTDSAVRITHIPTGIVVECQEDRSQHKNKAQAMSILAARIKSAQHEAQQSHRASTRKNLIGSGDRSQRIRTYNFPQGRITDHRINLTLYKIEAMMDGDLDELFSALSTEHQADLLANFAE